MADFYFLLKKLHLFLSKRTFKQACFIKVVFKAISIQVFRFWKMKMRTLKNRIFQDYSHTSFFINPYCMCLPHSVQSTRNWLAFGFIAHAISRVLWKIKDANHTFVNNLYLSFFSLKLIYYNYKLKYGQITYNSTQ